MKEIRLTLNVVLTILVCFILLRGCNKEDNELTFNEVTQANDLKSLIIESTPDIIVTTTSDAADFNETQQVSDLPGSDGLVSLREAIIAANNTIGPQVIGFNIPISDPGFDGNVFVIQPFYQLPVLSGGFTTINGITQTNFTGDTNPNGSEIVLNGNVAAEDTKGLQISSSYNVVHHLVINGFPGSDGNGLTIEGFDVHDNMVTGCYIGLNSQGTMSVPNEDNGIRISGGAFNNTVGGNSPELRNVISGNNISGVSILDNNTRDNIIIGNYIGLNRLGEESVANGSGINIGAGSLGISHNNTIEKNIVSGNLSGGIILHGNTSNNNIKHNYVGTDPTGSKGIGNGWVGVYMEGSNNLCYANLISGNHTGVWTELRENIIRKCFIGTNFIGNEAIPNAGCGILARGDHMLVEDNLISGNMDNGVVTHGSGTIIKGNKIGTDHSGKNPLPNGPSGGTGVSIAEDSKDVLVFNNTIAFNLSAGVAVTQTATNNTISANSIFSNKTLGIDLGVEYHGDGVTPNDPGDVDTGPNDFMNYPVLTSAMATPGKLLVFGTIDAPDPETIKIEFYANPVPDPGEDPSGHGEGTEYLGFTYPNVKGKFVIPLPPVEVGTIITATATDKDGNTSEFSKNFAATEPPPDFVIGK
jgi:parallel beta-helix repeat protein